MGNALCNCENCSSSNPDKTSHTNGFHQTVPDIYRSYHSYLKFKKKANQCSKNNREEIVTDHFVDAEFPPENKSLYRDGGGLMRKTILHSTGFGQVKIWLRPFQIYSLSTEKQFPISMFNNPSPKDVIQGELGTCWFLSALALVAERPIILYNSILTKQYNPSGIHQIRLCKRGEWKVITIDDYLPCDKLCKLVFSRAKRNQFWVPFMEKALAKMYASYENIAKGACAEGLQTVTGEPCEVLYLRLNNANTFQITSHTAHYSEKEHVWHKIIHSKNAGYLLTTLCYNDGLSELSFLKNGLLNRHIYSILDVREFKEFSGITYRLLKLRNPWGRKEWKGAWSHSWPHWPPHIKAEINAHTTTKDSGCFWIAFEDVLKYFYDITICKVRPHWTESRQSSFFFDFSQGVECYVITVTQPGVHEFEIELFSTGYFNESFDRNEDPTYDLCLVLCKIDGTDLTAMQCVAFEHSVEYYVTLAANVSPGSYVVFATSVKGISPLGHKSKLSMPNDYATYNIVFHSATKFIVNRTRMSKDFAGDVFYAVARMQNSYKMELGETVRSYIIQGSCTHAILIENLSADAWIKVSLDTRSSTNLESTRLSPQTLDVIKPSSRQIITFLTPLNYRNGYVIGYKLDIVRSDECAESSHPEVTANYSGLHCSGDLLPFVSS